MTETTNIDHWNQDSVAKDKLTAKQEQIITEATTDLKLKANQLTDQQEQIQERLRSILDELKESFQTYEDHFFEKKIKETDETNIEHLKKFLDAENNEDLQIVLNLQREDGTTMLHDVADFYDGVTELLLDAGADSNIPDNAGKTPLQMAIDYHRFRAVGLFFDDKLKKLPDKQKELNEELLNLLNDVHYTSADQKYNLEYTLDSDSIADLMEFLKHNEKENSEDLKFVLNLPRGQFGSTILHQIDRFFYAETLNLLLEAGADPNIQDVEGKTPLHYAAQYNHQGNLTQLLVEGGADPNIQDKEGYTPLHIAARFDYQENVIQLLNAGANPNIEDMDGNTPLRLAIICERLGIVESFLENDKIDVNLKYKETEDSPIFDAVATRTSDGDIADLMIKSGKVDLTIKNKRGMTVLHEAAAMGQSGIIQLLLQRGTNVNDIDGEGNNPLHYIVYNKYYGANNGDAGREFDYSNNDNIIAIIDAFMSYCVEDVSKRINEKLMMLAQETSEKDLAKIQCEIEKFELERYVKAEEYINTKNKDGNTPLFFAIEREVSILANGSGKNYVRKIGLDVIAKLLKKGAEVNITNKNGYTPLHYAIKSKSPEILKLLLITPFELSEIMSHIQCAVMHNNSQIFHNMPDLYNQLACIDIATEITEKVLPSVSYKDNNEESIGKKIEDILPNYMKEDIEFYQAIRNNVPKIIESVVKTTSARLSIHDKEGNTLLHHAIKWGCGEEILDFLVKNGVDINAKNNNGVAPIHIAAKYGKLSQMQYLKQHGADLNIQCGKFSKSAIDNIGKEKELSDGTVDNYINIKGANVDASSTVNVKSDTSYGNATPTFIAADNLNVNAVHMLASEGVNPNIPNKIGATPLHVAAARILNKDYEKYEISDVYAMFEGLALFSTENLLHCKKLIETLDGGAKTKEKLNKILDEVTNSRKSNKKCTAPVDVEVSAPVFDGNFLEKIDIQGIPDLSDKIKKLAAGNYGVAEWDPQGDHSELQYQREVTPEKIQRSGDHRMREWDPQGDHSDLQYQREVIPEMISKQTKVVGTEPEWSTVQLGKLQTSIPWGNEDNGHECGINGNHVIADNGAGIWSKSPRQTNNGEGYIDNNLNTQNAEQKEESANETDSEESSSSLLADTTKQKINVKEESTLDRTKLTMHNKVKLDNFLSKVSKAQNIIELNKTVSEALRSGIRLNFSEDKEHNFTDYVIEKIYELNIKKDPKIASNIICKLVAKGAILNESYKKVNEELKKSKDFEDHKINIQKANTEFCKHINEFQGIVKNALNKGKLQNLDIDNTIFSLEYSQDSIIDVAKIIDGTKGLGLNQGGIAFGGNIVKIGENAVEIEIKDNGKRNYTDISDSGDVILTFQTSLGELDVRLYSDTQNKDVIKVEVSDRQIFDQLKDEDKKEIGKNCLFGGLSVSDAIQKGYFEKSGKLQSSETTSRLSQNTKEKSKETTKDLNVTVNSVLKDTRVSKADRAVRQAGM